MQSISEIKLRNVIENSSLAILLTNPNGGIFEVNRAACKMFGYSPVEFTKTGRYGILKNDEALKESVKIRRERGEVRAELTGLRKNGEEFPCEVYSTIYTNHEGELRSSTSIIDISERKEKEKLAEYNQKAFESLYNHNPEAVYSFDLQGNFTSLNKAAEKLGEGSREDLMKMTFLPLIAEEDRERVLQNFQKAARGEVVKYQTGFVSLRQNKAILEVTNFPMFINDEIVGVYGIAKNVSTQLRAEQKLQEERNLLRAIIDNIPDYIFVVDREHKTLLVNRKFHRDLLGFDAEAPALGLQPTDYYPEHEAKLIIEDNKRLMESGEIVLNREDKVITFKRNTETILLTKVPLINVAGEITGLVGIARDISEIKAKEKKLEEVNKELQITNRELEEFAYVASHDLQEPLRMITGFLERLKQKYTSELDEKAQQYIYYAQDGAIRMRTLIRDLLEYSRAGRFENQAEAVDVNLVVRDILKLQQKSIREKKAEILYNHLPIIKSHRIAVQQLLTNLIQNALKYQRPGVAPRITIECREADTKYVFSVADNGIGIEPGFENKIFEVFQRLHSRAQYSGTGLGLAVCQKIVDNLGGKIWVEANEPEGSIFKFSLKKLN
ncbi:PAS domain-containing sensor histidine kinase [Salegentibacter sp. HM20]